jgi:hypothetical protein
MVSLNDLFCWIYFQFNMGIEPNIFSWIFQDVELNHEFSCEHKKFFSGSTPKASKNFNSKSVWILKQQISWTINFAFSLKRMKQTLAINFSHKFLTNWARVDDVKNEFSSRFAIHLFYYNERLCLCDLWQGEEDGRQKNNIMFLSKSAVVFDLARSQPSAAQTIVVFVLPI